MSDSSSREIKSSSDTSLLESALNNRFRRICRLNVLFAGLDKAPKLPWEKWQTTPQRDDDVIAYYNAMEPQNITCWGLICGYNELTAIDFDWPWIYRLWRKQFGDRADTLTMQTPNGGFRPYFLSTSSITDDKFKETLHVEIKGPGRFVVYEGRAKREDGSIGEYKVTVNKPMRSDDTIIQATLTFLKELSSRLSFLQWNCLQPYFSKKQIIDLPHDVRLFITDIMVYEGLGDDEICELFRDLLDFDAAKTRYQIDYTRKRVQGGLKPPSCNTFWKMLNWNPDECRGCARKQRVLDDSEFTLQGFHLTCKGGKAFLIDRTGKPVWSCNLESLDGPRAKNQLKEITGLDEREVNKVTAAFTFSLQQKEDSQEDKKIEEGLKPIEITLSQEELQRRAVELLKSSDLLYRVKTICEKGVIADRYRFVLGEDDKKLLAFLIAISAKSQWPQSIWTTGSSGFGKSNLIVVTLKLMPSGYAKIRSYLTGAGLRYGKQDYKVLFIREWRQFAEQDIRLMSREDGSYTFEVAVKDRETGEWTTQEGEIPAKTIITTSAERLPSIQMLRRCWLLSVDETPKLTEDINKRKANYRAGKVEPASPDEIAVIQQAVLLLEPADVIIPYAEHLVNLVAWDRTRLDYFLDIISVVAWLHQIRRVKDSTGKIVATPADLYMAMRISWSTLMQSLMQLPERLKRCWQLLPDDPKAAGLTTKELALALSVAQSTVRGYLADLINLNYAVSERREKSRERQYWKSGTAMGTAESAESAFSRCDWLEIAASVENALKQAPLEDVLNQQGGSEEFQVCDPLTGENAALPPPTDSAHVVENPETGSSRRKELDSGVSHVLNGHSAHSALQQERLQPPFTHTGECAICRQRRPLRRDRFNERYVCQACYDEPPTSRS